MVSGQLCLIFVLQIRKDGRTMCVLLWRIMLILRFMRCIIAISLWILFPEFKIKASSWLWRSRVLPVLQARRQVLTIWKNWELPTCTYCRRMIMPRWMKQNWTRPNIIGGMIRKITMCLTVLILQILINLMSVSGNSNKWYKLYIRRESEWCLMWCIITPSIQTKAISNVRFPVISIARRRTGNGQMVRDVEMKRQATAPWCVNIW